MGGRLVLTSSNAQVNDIAQQNGYPGQALLLVALGQLLALLVVATRVPWKNQASPNTCKHGRLFKVASN